VIADGALPSVAPEAPEFLPSLLYSPSPKE
jgi:hypothetical protein